MRETELSQVSGVRDNPHLIELGVEKAGLLECGLTVEEFFSQYEFNANRYLTDEEVASIPELDDFPSEGEFVGLEETDDDYKFPIMYYFRVNNRIVKFDPAKPLQ